eukprot:CFRG1260T1
MSDVHLLRSSRLIVKHLFATKPARILRNVIPLGLAFVMAPPFLVSACVIKCITRPISKPLAAAADEMQFGLYMSYVVLLYETISNTEIVWHGDDITKYNDPNVLCLCNHQSTMDWVLVQSVAMRQSLYAMGAVRYVMKAECRYMPFYGLYLYMHGCPFVWRNWKVDEGLMKKTIDWLSEGNRPLWMGLFPEGTRYSAERLASSNRYCEKREISPLQHVLAPRSRGFELLLAELKETKPDLVIYDITFAYRENTTPRQPSSDPHFRPNMFVFLGGACSQVDIRIKRIPVSTLRADDADERHCEKWLHQLFHDKDEWLAQIFSEQTDSRNQVRNAMGSEDKLCAQSGMGSSPIDSTAFQYHNEYTEDLDLKNTIELGPGHIQSNKIQSNHTKKHSLPLGFATASTLALLTLCTTPYFVFSPRTTAMSELYSSGFSTLDNTSKNIREKQANLAIENDQREREREREKGREEQREEQREERREGFYVNIGGLLFTNRLYKTAENDL